MTSGVLLWFVLRKLYGFQDTDAFLLQDGAEGFQIAGTVDLVLDAAGQHTVQAGDLHGKGRAVRQHPGLEIGQVLFQLRAAGQQGLPM